MYFVEDKFMNFQQYDLGYHSGGEIVEVTLSGNAAEGISTTEDM